MLKIAALDKLSKKLPKLSAAWRWSLIVAFIALGMVGIWTYVSKQQAAKEAAAKQQLIAAIKIKTVTALGTLAPQGEIVKLSAPTSIDGVKIERLLVGEGDTVKTGQVIAILDSRGRLEAALEEAKAKVSVAQASLATTKAGAKQGEINAQKATITRLQAERVTGIELLKATLAKVIAETDTQTQSLKATLAKVIAETDTQTASQIGAIAEAQAGFVNAQAENKRYAALALQGAVSKSTGDTKRLTLQTSQQQVIQARANLNRIKSSGKQQINEARANLSKTQKSGQQQINEARANLRKTETSMYQQIREGQFTLNKIAEVRPVDVMSAETNIKSAIATQKVAVQSLSKAYIRSPLNGQIFKIFSHPGEVVSTTDGIADLGKTSQMYGVVEVYNNDANKIRAGQQVKLTSSSLSGELRGTVERIGTYIKRQDVINADPTSNIDNRVIEVHVILDPASSKRAANFTNLQVQAVIELNS
jgi:HlyD family secretion protein